MKETFPKTSERFPSYEEQLNVPHLIPIDGEIVEIIDVCPENVKDPVPVMMVLGWSESPRSQEKNIRANFDNGRRVISPNTPHGIEPGELVEGVSGHPAVELRKMAGLIKSLEALGIEKVDIVAHSEGAIYAILTAYLFPEKVRNVVLVNPAGMIGKDSLPRLMVGFSADLTKQVIKDLMNGGPTFLLNGLKVLSKNPLQAIKSVLAIANSDIRDMLRDVREQGTKITVIATTDDIAFPMKKMQEALGGGDLDGLYSLPGSHNEYLTNPEPYAKITEHALSNMAANKKGESEEINP